MASNRPCSITSIILVSMLIEGITINVATRISKNMQINKSPIHLYIYITLRIIPQTMAST